MRARLFTVSVFAGFALVLAACGGGSSDSGGAGNGGSNDAAPTTSGPGSGDSGGSGRADVDCAAIAEAQVELIQVQLLAQLRDPDSIETLRSGTIGRLDLEKFSAAMDTLHQLDGFDGPLGDPREAIDAYEQASIDAKALFDADPVTQEMIDEYNASIGSPVEFLGRQAAIAGALDEAGC